MASTSSTSLSFIFLPSPPHPTRKTIKDRSCTATFASKRESHDQNYSKGRVVDENLIVLRKRIHEMKMIERNYEPPADWSDWEKNYYVSYDSYICEAMGFIQSQLMDTRPSLAIGIMALVTMSLPFSTLVIISNVLEISKGILGGIHIS